MKPGIDPKVDYVFKWLFGNQVHETITVCFVNSVLFPDVPDYHLRFEPRSEKHPHLLFCDQQEIHVVELPKFTKSEVELSELIDSWCYFLIHGDTMDTEKMSESLSPVRPALEELGKFAQDDVERQRYRDRIKALRDQKSFELDAREEGKLIGSIQNSQMLLEQPITPEAELASMSRAGLRSMAEALQEQAMKAMRARKLPEGKQF